MLNSLLACGMQARYSFTVPLTCSSTIDIPLVLQQGYLEHKRNALHVGLLASIQELCVFWVCAKSQYIDS
jgi:hypothetical protein